MRRMSGTGHLAVGTLLVAALLLAPGRASAQGNIEISGGYSYLHEADLSVPAGWYASGGGYLNNWFGIVGEVSGHYKTVDVFGVDVKTSVYLFGAGPKFVLRRNPTFTPFAQALFGGGRLTGSVSIPGQSSSFNDSRTGFASQIGGGVDINPGGPVGVRVQVARASIESDGEWFGETLFMAGVVIHP